MLKINNYTYEYVYLCDMNLLMANQFLEALSWHNETQMLLHPVWRNNMLKIYEKSAIPFSQGC